jgi:tRNA threonylcarbamoyladenosine biosynthesis protein TsaB
VTVLAIETATAVCGVALVQDGTVRAEESVRLPNTHAERLMDLLDTVLRRTGVAVRDLDAVAVSIGPGSFTGLRIGLSVAKGLAWAHDLPVVPVPTLRALAARAVGPSEEVLSLIPARKGEVYAQRFRTAAGGPEALGEIRVAGVVQLAQEVAGTGLLLTGEGASHVAAAAAPGAVRLAEPGLRECSAASVALLGARMVTSAGAAPAGRLEPLYVLEFRTAVPPSH